MEDILKVSIRNLSHHKARTLLTLLGVVVGISAVVALISLGAGLNQSIHERFEQLGPNRIFIAQNARGGFNGPPSGGVTLSEDDLEIIRRVNDIESAVPFLQKILPVKYGDESVITPVGGIPTEEAEEFFSDIQTFEIAEGRFMKEGERNVVVIGSRVSTEMFNKDVHVRDTLKISGKNVQVIGIMKSTGSQENDNLILMSIEALRDVSGADEGEITAIMAKARENPKATANKVEQELEDFHGDKLFIAYTSQELVEQIGQIFSIISLILAGIAGISLLVASFGIINTMLMSVLERTREIGIMKAIGATNRRVLLMFLTESAIVGFIGGVLGVIFGYAMSFSLAGIGINFLGVALTITIDPLLIAFVLAFSTVVGVIAGVYPAYRAAKLDPIEALRYG